MMRKKEEIPERVIAKGKKKEVLRDKVAEIGEEIFDLIIEKWREIGFVVLVILLLGLGIWIFQERRKNKLSEELAKFENAMLLISAYDINRDEKNLKEAERILSEIEDNPRFIPELYLAWVRSKKGETKKAVESLNRLIQSEDTPPDVKRMARIMKIHILDDCEEVIKTWKELRKESEGAVGLLPVEEEEGKKERRSMLLIPLRTYFEVIKCAGEKDGEILSSIISELGLLHSVEQLVMQDRAKFILMIRKFAEMKLKEAREKARKSEEGKK